LVTITLFVCARQAANAIRYRSEPWNGGELCHSVYILVKVLTDIVKTKIVQNHARLHNCWHEFKLASERPPQDSKSLHEPPESHLNSDARGTLIKIEIILLFGQTATGEWRQHVLI
jgi:hypothetical protein